MQIKLNNIIPAPMAGISFDDSRIWAKSLDIDTAGAVLVKADSGRGKSTLISFLYSNRKDFSGTIELDGKDITHLSLDELAHIRQTRMSIVFQDMRLFPELTARENIEVKYKLARGVKENEINEMAERMGLKDQLNQTCGTLSLGQQQRVAVIRALVQPFELILMDEPFSHLDKTNTAIAVELIQRRCNEQKAGMLITSLGEDHGIKFTQELSV